MMDAVKTFVINNLRKFGMLIALVSIIILFQVLTNGMLLTPLNITNIIMQGSYIIILAIGMMLVIITGNIDLSVGSVSAFVGALAAIMMISYEISVISAVLLCLLIGAGIGAWQGFWVAYVQIPSFIVTLAGMLTFRGLTLAVLGGATISSFPEGFRSMSAGFIPDVFENGALNITAIVLGVLACVVYGLYEWKRRSNRRKFDMETSKFSIFSIKVLIMVVVILMFTYTLASYAGLPYVLIILSLLVIGYTFITNKTVFGRHVYAVGGNEPAAKLSGVKTKKVTFLIFVNMGVLAALSGMIFAGRLDAATPGAGDLFELDAIAAAFIGGASMKGGVGTIFGAVLGALVMGVLDNGMSLMGVGTDWQQTVKGLVLLAAVAFDIISKNKGN